MRRWWAPTPPHALPPDEWPDLLVMAATLLGEAEGETIDGKRAVAFVIMNRVADERWPDTPGGVCLQRLQFSCWNVGSPRLHRMFKPQGTVPEEQWSDCFWVSTEAMFRLTPDPSCGANHYLAPKALKRLPSWASEDKIVAQIGGHVFYKL